MSKEKLLEAINELNEGNVGAFIPKMSRKADLLLEEFNEKQMVEIYEIHQKENNFCNCDFCIYVHVKYVKGHHGIIHQEEEITQEDKERIYDFLGLNNEEGRKRVKFGKKEDFFA